MVSRVVNEPSSSRAQLEFLACLVNEPGEAHDHVPTKKKHVEESFLGVQKKNTDWYILEI